MSDKKPEPFLPKDKCACLRTKTMALNTHWIPSEAELRSRADTAIFWCIKTMMPWGPDEDDATPESCRPGRECWDTEADPT